MIVTALIFLVSIFGLVAAFSWPGWSDLILLAGPCAIASVILLFRETKVWLAKRAPDVPKAVVVDGSNVMYWRDGKPSIETVQDVVRHLTALGFKTGVMFDANAGYLFAGSDVGEKAISKLLKIPVKNVMIVPKGSPADPFILTAAREMGGIVISNDRFRDWAADYPEVATPGHLIKGEYRQGHLWFDFATHDGTSKAA